MTIEAKLSAVVVKSRERRMITLYVPCDSAALAAGADDVVDAIAQRGCCAWLRLSTCTAQQFTRHVLA
jgi:hypothetical protein